MQHKVRRDFEAFFELYASIQCSWNFIGEFQLNASFHEPGYILMRDNAIPRVFDSTKASPNNMRWLVLSDLNAHQTATRLRNFRTV